MGAKNSLGRGFDGLVPQGTSIDGVTVPKTEKVHQLAIDCVRPRANQPRQNFDEHLLDQLALSIKAQGILQPIVVSQIEHNLYSIIAGERRWRAAQLAGLTNVPAIIKEVDDLQHLELALLENIQRSDLNAIETAKSIQRLHVEYQQSYETIAKKLGKAYTTVVNAVRLLQLPIEMQDAIVNGKISEGHGRALLSLSKMPSVQVALFRTIIDKKLSVRQAESLAITAKLKVKVGNRHKPSHKPTYVNKLSQQLSQRIGADVHVPKSKKKGKITITYTSEAELEQIIQSLLS